MMMSHLPALTAAMMVSKTLFTNCPCKPSRLAISMPISTSEPVGLLCSSKNSIGGYGKSLQISNLPFCCKASAGTCATGVGGTVVAVGATVGGAVGWTTTVCGTATVWGTAT